ncbi:hypothetical protein ACIQMV_38315 [Streptomyces sp. NPDC091412]|uniref:hypothetical protein n=1 Tax=Streptomyces sp. NPDC091412 TaxID=3366002 RepID=UPI00382D8205
MGTLGHFDPPSAAGGPTADFWRTPQVTGGALPDGTNDPTEAIARTGRVGIGPAFAAAAPVAQLDVATAARTGTDRRDANTAAYVTGALPSIVACSPPATPVTGVVEFLHSNQTVGVGIAWNGIYAAGSATNQDLALMQRGNGSLRDQWQAKAGGYATSIKTVADARVLNGGFQELFYDGPDCVYVGGHYLRASSLTPLDTYHQWNITTGGAARNALELRATRNCADALEGAYMRVAGTEVHRKKLTLHDANPGDNARFYGFGILGSTLVYQVDSTNAWHRWYAATGACASQEVFAVSGQALAVVDPSGLNNGGNGAGALRFGAEGSNVAITSNWADPDGVNYRGLNFITGGRFRSSISAGGLFRHQRWGGTADANRKWVNGTQALIQFDEAGSGGGYLSPILWLENNNCGGPCGQGTPPQLIITNSNSTNSLRGWISFLRSPGDQTELASVRAQNSGNLELRALNVVQLIANNAVRLTAKSTGVINISGLPSSATGLAAGDVWRDSSGVLHAV